jgi:hypothetical protein
MLLAGVVFGVSFFGSAVLFCFLHVIDHQDEKWMCVQCSHRHDGPMFYAFECVKVMMSWLGRLSDMAPNKQSQESRMKAQSCSMS